MKRSLKLTQKPNCHTCIVDAKTAHTSRTCAWGYRREPDLPHNIPLESYPKPVTIMAFNAGIGNRNLNDGNK